MLTLCCAFNVFNSESLSTQTVIEAATKKILKAQLKRNNYIVNHIPGGESQLILNKARSQEVDSEKIFLLMKKSQLHESNRHVSGTGIVGAEKSVSSILRDHGKKKV